MEDTQRVGNKELQRKHLVSTGNDPCSYLTVSFPYYPWWFLRVARHLIFKRKENFHKYKLKAIIIYLVQFKFVCTQLLSIWTFFTLCAKTLSLVSKNIPHTESALSPFFLFYTSFCIHGFQFAYFFKLGFILCKAEQPLGDMGLQEKEENNEKNIRKIFRKRSKKKMPITLHFKLFRSDVKGKHSVGRDFQSLAARRKKLLT